MSGKQSRTISSSVIGSRFIGRSVPSTRTIGGLSTLRCKSLALSFTQARNSLSISRSALRLMKLLLKASSLAMGKAFGCQLSAISPKFNLLTWINGSTGGANVNSPRGHHSFRLFYRILAEVKNAGRQGRVRFSYCNCIGKVFGLAGAAAGDDRDADRFAHGGRNFQVVTILGAVGIHAGQDNFTCPEPFDLLSPGDGLQARGHAAAVDVNFPHLPAIALDPFRIDIYDNTLASKPASGVVNELRVFHRGRVDRNFVGTSQQQLANVFDRADASAHRKRHEDLLCGAANDFKHDVAAFMTGGNVEKDELVGAFLLIASSDLDGIARIAKVHEVCALHHASTVDIETWNHTFSEHYGGAFWNRPDRPRLSRKLDRFTAKVQFRLSALTGQPARNCAESSSTRCRLMSLRLDRSPVMTRQTIGHRALSQSVDRGRRRCRSRCECESDGRSLA